MRVYAWADGASRGNPGPAAYGYVLVNDFDAELDSGGEAIGRATNNVAEYRGAIAALEAALRIGATSVVLQLDSELVVLQAQGQYKVRKAKLKPLHAELLRLADQFEEFEIRHVPRDFNSEADALANNALNQSQR